MSITIKLDAPALKALIADDAEFKLELQRSVVAEVVRNTVLKDLSDVIKAVMPHVTQDLIQHIKADKELAAGIEKKLRELIPGGSGWGQHNPKLNNEAKALIDEHVKSALGTQVRDQIKASGFDPVEKVQELWATFEKWLKTEVPGRIRNEVDAATAKAIRVGVEERLAEIRAAL